MDNLDDWTEILTSKQQSNQLRLIDKTTNKKLLHKQLVAKSIKKVKKHQHDSLYIKLNSNKFIANIVDSYTDKNVKIIKVCNQIILDIPRMYVTINKQRVKTFDDFIKKIQYLEQVKLSKNDVLCNLTELILVLTTQASFFYQFETIHRFYSDLNRNIYITSSSDAPSIEISIKDKQVLMIFKKNFACISINENNPIYKFLTILKAVFIVENNACYVDNIIMFWSKLNC